MTQIIPTDSSVTTRHLFFAGAMATLAIIALNAIVAYRAIKTVSSNEGWVAHTQEVRANLSALQADFLDMQRSVRGYVISQRGDFLQSYQRSQAREKLQLQTVQELTVDNPRQQLRIGQLATKATDFQLLLDRFIELAKRNDRSAEALVGSGAGEALMGDINRRIDDMQEEEKRLLAIRAEQTRSSIRRSFVALSIASVVGLALLLATVLLTTRGLRERLRANERIRELLVEVQQRADELEGKVRERTVELEESNKVLRAFSSSVSHDLRAPLRGLIGVSEALLQDYAEAVDDLGRKYLSSLRDSAKLMDVLIEDLLTYSQLLRSEIKLEPVNVNNLLQELRSQMADELGGADIRETAVLPIVIGYRPVLKQVLRNLLSNAAKFSKDGARPVITLSSRVEGDSVRISISDEGIGIPAEHTTRIFEPFERLHGAEKYRGTGIGLAIVKRGVERMGGAVGVTSVPGEGSAFWIELPRAA